MAEEEILLAVDSDGRGAGGCLLDVGARRLTIIEDIHADVIATVTALVTQLQCTKVLISSRSDTAMCDLVCELSAQGGFSHEILRAKSFARDSGMRAVDLILDSSQDPLVYPLISEMKYAKNMQLVIGCFGALGSVIENKSLLADQINPLSSLIRSVERLASEDFVYMDPDSFYALQIFKPFNEPPTGMKSCVFDYINMTGSVLGGKLLKSWMYRPSAKIEVIRERHETLGCLLEEQNARLHGELVTLMKKLGNIQVFTNTMCSSTPKLPTWQGLVIFLRNAIEIITVIQSFRQFQETSLGHMIVEQVDLRIVRSLLSSINEIIDFDSSKEWKRVYVKDGVNQGLDDLRMKYNTLEETLQVLAYDLGREYRQFPNDGLNVVYIPQLGFLISIDNQYLNDSPRQWTEIFQTITTGYYKDVTMEKIDEDYGDIYQLMVDCEIEILFNLQTKVNDESTTSMLLNLGWLFAELDCFLSLASVCALHDFIKPEMCEDHILFIEQGRHILVEQSVPSFVPNDTSIPEQTLSMVTGANSSGKSVYLISVGIIVFLAHIGCHVPARRATIGVTDKMLTRIVTREAIDKCESTFFIDLQNMSRCMTMCTPRSLMLVDEFGKGTDAVGGPSLFGAIIESLAQAEFTPRTIMTTHFHELFKDSVLQGTGRVKHSHMDVIFAKEQNSAEKITYLFKLQDGLATDSFGINCAEVCGIPSHIIARAREISMMPYKILGNELDQEELNRAKHVTREFLLWDLERETTDEYWKDKVYQLLNTALPNNT